MDSLRDNDDIWYGFDDATTWHIDLYYIMILYDDKMLWGHSDGYVVLRAFMDGLVIEAVCGETMIHSIEAVWKILARKK